MIVKYLSVNLHIPVSNIGVSFNEVGLYSLLATANQVIWPMLCLAVVKGVTRENRPDALMRSRQFSESPGISGRRTGRQLVSISFENRRFR